MLNSINNFYNDLENNEAGDSEKRLGTILAEEFADVRRESAKLREKLSGTLREPETGKSVLKLRERNYE